MGQCESDGQNDQCPLAGLSVMVYMYKCSAMEKSDLNNYNTENKNDLNQLHEAGVNLIVLGLNKWSV